MKFEFRPKSDLEKFGEKIFFALVENSVQTFFVGGMLRNMVLGKKIDDIDIATALAPDEVIKILEVRNIDFKTRGKFFGTVTPVRNSIFAEVTTFRKDSYTGSRYPNVTFVTNPKIDSRRRDFTMNSLYFQPNSNTVLDYHGGLRDIKNRLVRFIGNPRQRIVEDPLRIVRAFRFAITLNFSIEHKTFTAIKNNFSALEKISPTRIESEIKKIKSHRQQTIIKKVINSPVIVDKYFK